MYLFFLKFIFCGILFNIFFNCNTFNRKRKPALYFLSVGFLFIIIIDSLCLKKARHLYLSQFKIFLLLGRQSFLGWSNNLFFIFTESNTHKNTHVNNQECSFKKYFSFFYY